eukprot:5838054-Prymnesium_polylepis.1
MCPQTASVFHSTNLLPPEVYNVTSFNSTAETGHSVEDYNFRYFKMRLLFRLLWTELPGRD